MSEPEGRHVQGSSQSGSISFSISNVPCKSDEDKYCSSASHDKEQLPNMLSIGVFDGHGGEYASKKCELVLHKNILAKYWELITAEGRTHLDPFDENIFCKATREATIFIDSYIRKKNTTGTTMVSLFCLDRIDGSTRVICPWVGDSSCMMWTRGPDGRIVQYNMSQDHKPNVRREYDRIYDKTDQIWDDMPLDIQPEMFRDNEKDWGEQKKKLEVPKMSGDNGLTGIELEVVHSSSFIKRRTIEAQPEVKGPIAVFGRYNVSLCMTRSIGDRHGPRGCIPVPDITGYTVPEDQHARFVFGSDGMWDVLNDKDITPIVMTMKDPQKLSRKLALMSWHKRIVKAMRMDDITVVVVDVHPNHFKEDRGGGGGGGAAAGAAGGGGCCTIS